jgi:membrane-bound inhibitor of C-type lysozyme
MRTALVGSVLALAGCAAHAPPAPAAPVFHWRCDGGASFTVRYVQGADPLAGQAIVEAGGQTYTLPLAPSGSGARYATDTVEYWEHQGEAMLNGAAGGPYAHCTQAGP